MDSEAQPLNEEEQGDLPAKLRQFRGIVEERKCASKPSDIPVSEAFEVVFG